MQLSVEGDALQLLKKDHVELRKLVDACESDIGLYREFRNRLITHVHLEEHNLAMQLLQELDEVGPFTKTWRAKFHTLKNMIHSHFEQEEKGLFPLIDQQTTIQDLAEFCKQMKDRRELIDVENILYPEVPGEHKLSVAQ